MADQEREVTQSDNARSAMLERRREQQREHIRQQMYREQHQKLQECLQYWADLKAKGKTNDDHRG